MGVILGNVVFIFGDLGYVVVVVFDLFIIDSFVGRGVYVDLGYGVILIGLVNF